VHSFAPDYVTPRRETCHRNCAIIHARAITCFPAPREVTQPYLEARNWIGAHVSANLLLLQRLRVYLEVLITDCLCISTSSERSLLLPGASFESSSFSEHLGSDLGYFQSFRFLLSAAQHYGRRLRRALAGRDAGSELFLKIFTTPLDNSHHRYSRLRVRSQNLARRQIGSALSTRHHLMIRQQTRLIVERYLRAAV